MRKLGLALTILFLLVAAVGTYLALRPSEEAVPSVEDGGAAAGAPGEPGAPVLLAAGKRPGDPQAQKGSFALTGKVLDLAGAPVPGVRVTATRAGPAYDMEDRSTWVQFDATVSARKRLETLTAPVAGEPKVDAEAVSGAEGRFSITVKETGAYLLRALPGAPRVGSVASVQLLARKPAEPVWLRVRPGVPLAGRVVDANDRPVSGAVVTGSWQTQDGGFSSGVFGVATGSDGTFAWDAVPEGTCTAAVAVPGRGTYSGYATPSPRADPWVLRLPAARTIHGRVLDSAGVGIADVDLIVSTLRAATPSAAGPSELRGRSGPDGAYRVEGVSPGPVSSVWLLPTGAYLAELQAPPRAPWSGAEVKPGEDLVLDLVLSRGGSIEVTVVGEDGAPLEGAEVTALGSQASGGMYARAMPTPTDREGRARIEGLALGRYVLYVRHATHYVRELELAPRSFSMNPDGSVASAGPPPSLLALLVKEGDVVRRTLRMTRGLAVTGRVTGPDGAPVAQANVERSGGDASQAVWNWGVAWNGPVNEGVASEADGRFRLDGLAPSDALVLIAKKAPLAGTPSEPVQLAAGAPPPEVNLVMAVGASLVGTVLDADGKSVAGCQLDYWGGDGTNWTNGHTATDEAGAFRVEGLAVGNVTLNVRATSGMTKQVQVAPPLKEGERREGFVVRLVRSARVSGTTVDADGAPIGGIQLNASSPGEPGAAAYAVSQADGTFVIPAVPEGPVTIQALEQSEDGMNWSMPSAGPGGSVRAPAEGVKVVVARRLRTRVVVRIVGPDGSPIPLCAVSPAAPASTDGRMMYAGMGAGGEEVVGGVLRREFARAKPFDLVVRGARDADGLPMNLRPKTFSVTGDAEIEVRLEAGREVLGRLVGPDGAGVEGMSVSGGGSTSASAADGRFRLVGLAADGELDVTVQVTSGWIRPDPRRLAAGETSLTIALAKGLAIAGKVLGPDGEPVLQGYVQVQGGAPQMTQLGAGGRFRVEGLVPGALLDLVAGTWGQGGGRTVTVKAVRAGTEDLVIRLERGVAIEGIVVDAEGQPATQGWVMAQPLGDDGGGVGGSNGMIGPDGRFTLEGLRPGAYNLIAQASGAGNASQKVDAPARDVRLVLPARVRLSGRLLGSGDRSGFRVTAYGAAQAGAPAQRVGAGQTDVDGTFTLEVTGNGPFDLVATKSADDRFARLSDVRIGGSGPTLTLEAGLSIDGVVEVPEGGPVSEGTWVIAVSLDSRFAQRATPAADGSFRVRGLAPGKYSLRCGRPRTGGSPGSVEAEAGTSGHRLKLPEK